MSYPSFSHRFFLEYFYPHLEDKCFTLNGFRRHLFDERANLDQQNGISRSQFLWDSSDS